MPQITPEQRSRLPDNVRRAHSPPSIRDANAHAQLQSALAGAINALQELGADPIVIAASPNRFNDAWHSDWVAVRFGSFFTEQPSYSPRHNFYRDLRAGPFSATMAHDILISLEVSGWRDMFTDAFGVYWSDHILALVLEDSLWWLVFSSTNDTEENHVFALWDEQPISYFGECIERFDWEMQETPPLRFQVVTNP